MLLVPVRGSAEVARDAGRLLPTQDHSAPSVSANAPTQLGAPQWDGSLHVLPVESFFVEVLNHADALPSDASQPHCCNDGGGVSSEFATADAHPVTAAAEPATIVLLTTGFAGIGVLGLRRRRRGAD
jgi:hypothetical protein